MTNAKVLGHTPPDTDSTCSPIVYAWYLREVKGVAATAYISGQPNREALFVLEKFGTDQPQQLDQVNEGDNLVILDTNNPKELPEGYEHGKIVEIIDHHKLFGLSTSSPTKVTIREYGSVPTVMAEVMGNDVLDQIPANIAGLMLAPIISDTLNFTSSTTTDEDRILAKKLAKVAGVEIDEFADEMFAAKSNLEGMSIPEILLSDHKNFEFGEETYKIGVLETTDPSQALGMQDELIKEMSEIKQEGDLAGFFFFVVDIVRSEATLIVETEEEQSAAVEAFGAEFDDQDRMVLPGVVSRKKQIAPKLEGVLG